MNQEEMKQIIRQKLNFKKHIGEVITCATSDGFEYDGFDMSGYGESFHSNMELLSRFKNYFDIKDDERKGFCILPIFWKGGGSLIKLHYGYVEDSLEEICEIGGYSTEDIIFQIMKHENPKLITE